MKLGTILCSPARAVFALAVLSLAASPAPAQRGGGSSDSLKSSDKVLDAFKEVVSKPSQSVVRILAGEKEVALGTIIAADGLVLTKASLVGEKPALKLKDGKVLEAKVLGVHTAHDLALLKVDAQGLTPIVWRKAEEATPGDWVATVGTGTRPAGVGVVSVGARKMTTRSYPPAFNPQGGFLGINIAPDEDVDGVKIGQVQPDTAASKAGLEVNDVIVSVDKVVIRDPETLLSTLAKYKPGDTVTVKVKRGDDEKELKATLGRRPRDLGRGDFQNRMGSELSEHRSGYPEILQHDTVVKPSDCGGPLVDLDGRAIGVNIARAGRTESYAIPARVIEGLLPDLKSGKLTPKPAVTDKPKDSEKVEKARAELQAAEKAVAEAQKRKTEADEAVKKAERDRTAAAAALKQAEEDAKKVEKK